MERLKREGIRILEWREGSGLSETDLVAKVAQADAWIVAFHPVGAALMDAAPRLRLIAKHGVGVDNIDIPAATARGIVVTTAPSANDQAVADLPWPSCSPSCAGFPRPTPASRPGGGSDSWASG